MRSVVRALALLLLLSGCTRSSTVPRPPGVKETDLVATVVVAAELGPVGPKLVQSLSSLAGVRSEVVTCPLLELSAQLKKQRADFVLSPGPDDLVPLDQAHLLQPGAAVTLARSPLLLLAPAGHNAPTKLDLPAVSGVIGLPDKSAGAVADEARKLLKQGKPKLQERLAAPTDQLLTKLAGGHLALALLPAYAVPDQLAAKAGSVPSPVSDVVFAALRDAPHHYGMEQILRAVETFQPAAALKGTRLEPVGRKPRQATDKGLFVFAGAGIRDPLEAAATAFTQQTGVPVRYTYTGSACLLAQITMSQTGDVYIPGEEYFMQQAAERQYILTRKRIAYFVPVIMTAKGNPKHVRGLGDLSRPGLQVGLGEPKSCAIGTFTVKVLAKNRLYESVDRNTKMRTALAAELGTAIRLGSIDACVNWDAVAAWFQDSADIVPIPPKQNETTAILAGVLKFTKQQELAQRFVDFLGGPDGRRIFAQHHYTVDLQKPIFPYGAQP